MCGSGSVMVERMAAAPHTTFAVSYTPSFHKSTFRQYRRRLSKQWTIERRRWRDTRLADLVEATVSVDFSFPPSRFFEATIWRKATRPSSLPRMTVEPSPGSFLDLVEAEFPLSAPDDPARDPSCLDGRRFRTHRSVGAGRLARIVFFLAWSAVFADQRASSAR